MSKQLAFERDLQDHQARKIQVGRLHAAARAAQAQSDNTDAPDAEVATTHPDSYCAASLADISAGDSHAGNGTVTPCTFNR